MVPSFNKYNAWRARTPNSRMSILLLSILDSTPARHASVPDSLSLSIVIPIADLADRDAVLMRGFDLELFDCDRNRLFLGLGNDGPEGAEHGCGSGQRTSGPSVTIPLPRRLDGQKLQWSRR